MPPTKTSIQYLESVIDSVESRIQDCLGFSYMGRVVFNLLWRLKNPGEIGKKIHVIFSWVSDIARCIMGNVKMAISISFKIYDRSGQFLEDNVPSVLFLVHSFSPT